MVALCLRMRSTGLKTGFSGATMQATRAAMKARGDGAPESPCDAIDSSRDDARRATTAPESRVAGRCRHDSTCRDSRGGARVAPIRDAIRPGGSMANRRGGSPRARDLIRASASGRLGGSPGGSSGSRWITVAISGAWRARGVLVHAARRKWQRPARMSGGASGSSGKVP
jgi:hypothetical protein